MTFSWEFRDEIPDIKFCTNSSIVTSDVAMVAGAEVDRVDILLELADSSDEMLEDSEKVDVIGGIVIFSDGSEFMEAVNDDVRM